MKERVDPSTLSDFVVYADESGDHGLDRIDPAYPVFVLAFVVMSRTDYLHKVTPALQQLKFNYWGHDQVVFHEREIRKREGPFAILANPKTKVDFNEDLSKFVAGAPFNFLVGIIDKKAWSLMFSGRQTAYSIALGICMSKLVEFLQNENQEKKLIHVVFESRGKREDNELELEFRRIADGKSAWPSQFSFANFAPVFAKKDANAAGLQLADLIARPCGLKALRPEQSNRAFDVISEKAATGLGEWKAFP